MIRDSVTVKIKKKYPRQKKKLFLKHSGVLKKNIILFLIFARLDFFQAAGSLFYFFFFIRRGINLTELFIYWVESETDVGGGIIAFHLEKVIGH